MSSDVGRQAAVTLSDVGKQIAALPVVGGAGDCQDGGQARVRKWSRAVLPGKLGFHFAFDVMDDFRGRFVHSRDSHQNIGLEGWRKLCQDCRSAFRG